MPEPEIENKNEAGPPNPEKEGDSAPVFYYSRERRLQRASAAVRDLYEGKSIRPNLVRSLVGNRANVFLLVSILMVCAMFVLSSRASGKTPSGVKLGGNSLSLSIKRTDESSGGGLALFIKKNIPEKGEGYTGAVDIAVSPAQKKPPPGETNPPPEIITSRVFFTFTEEENYSLALPFGGEEFIVILQSENEQILRRLRPAPLER